MPELLFRNLGDKPVLLVEGEELVGAKQNRTLNRDADAGPLESGGYRRASQRRAGRMRQH